MRDNLFRIQGQQRAYTSIGRMYFFKYDPKTKDTLPVYDVYPLVFPMEDYHDGFLGMNIHYLDVDVRLRLLDRLKEYATSKKYTSRTRIQISYDLLNSTKNARAMLGDTTKRYLYGHVRSRFIEIPATEWDKAAQLSLQMFVRKN